MEVHSMKIAALTVEDAFSEIFSNPENEAWFRKNKPEARRKMAEAKYRHAMGTLTHEGKKQLLLSLGFVETQPTKMRLQ